MLLIAGRFGRPRLSVDQTVSLLRPFALRAFKTCRPALVAMSTEAGVRLRFRLLGWNVLFIVNVDS